MNFGELKAEVFRRLEENSSVPVYFTEDDIGDALNEGYEEMSDVSEWYETSSVIQLQANTFLYWLGHPSIQALTPLQAYNPQNSWWLNWYSQELLDREYRRWEKTGGQPQRMFTRGVWMLGFNPTPADSGTITLYHTAIPALMSADSDTPGFAREFHYGLIEYALYDLLCQDAEIPKAMKFWAKYKQKEGALRKFVDNRAQDRRVAFAGGQNSYRNI